LAVAVGAGTSSVAIGRETFLAAGDGEPLAVADVGGARMTGGGCIGTSGAVVLAVGPGDKTSRLAGLLHHRWRPLQ
jgi:hypothetical protein